MAANKSGYPTPPGPDDPDHRACPVCGWRPCTRRCRLGLSEEDLDGLERLFLPPSGEGRYASQEGEGVDGPFT